MREEVKRLLLQYRDVIDKLRSMKVVRTSKVVGEYGEYLVIKALSLKKADSSGNEGFDAIDEKTGEKYEIKTRKRVKWNEPTRFSLRKKQTEHFDFLVLVYFDDNWELTEVLKIPKTKLEEEDIEKGRILKKNIKNVYKKYSILNSVKKVV